MLSRAKSKRLCCRSVMARSYKPLSASAEPVSAAGFVVAVFWAAQPVKTNKASTAPIQLYFLVRIRFEEPFLNSLRQSFAGQMRHLSNRCRRIGGMEDRSARY